MNNELYHYGVLGMKWGVRKDRSSGTGRKKTVKSSSDKKSKASSKKKSQYYIRKSDTVVKDFLNLAGTSLAINASSYFITRDVGPAYGFATAKYGKLYTKAGLFYLALKHRPMKR